MKMKGPEHKQKQKSDFVIVGEWRSAFKMLRWWRKDNKRRQGWVGEQHILFV